MNEYNFKLLRENINYFQASAQNIKSVNEFSNLLVFLFHPGRRNPSSPYITPEDANFEQTEAKKNQHASNKSNERNTMAPMPRDQAIHIGQHTAQNATPSLSMAQLQAI